MKSSVMQSHFLPLSMMCELWCAVIISDVFYVFVTIAYNDEKEDKAAKNSFFWANVWYVVKM